MFVESNFPSITISLGKLWSLSPGRTSILEQLPLSALEVNSDIHGELIITIQGRVVPRMGFVEYDDVLRDGACLPEWIKHLGHLVKILASSSKASYRFEEVDSQDGPVFEFVRDEDRVFFSLSWPCGGKFVQPETEWEIIEFKLTDLMTEYQKFKLGLLDRIAQAKPEMRNEWAAKFVC